MNDETLQRIRDRVKEYNLSEQEVQTIDTARRQVLTYRNLGGFVGTTTMLVYSIRRRFSPLKAALFAGGGFFVAAQVGLIAGTLSAANTVKQSPHADRIIQLIKDMQREIATQGRQRLPPPPRPTAPHSSSSSNNVDEFASEHANDYGRLSSEFEREPVQQQQQQSSPWGGQATPPEQPKWQQPQQPQQQGTRQESAWDRIRAQNAPDSAWAKIRSEAMKAPPSEPQRRPNTFAERAAEQVPDELPRTREETEDRGGAVRRNQWGDPIE